MNNDPQKILDENPMSTMQFVAVAMCVLLNALDGFDVLSIAFSAPGITSDWGITRAALGIVLSMELIGMAFGAIVCGGLADKFGRRPLILGCLIVVGAGMLAAGMSTGVYSLSLFRLITGLGIGGLIASVNSLVAEYSNKRSKHTAVLFMAGGFPLGVIVGGMISSKLMVAYGWHSIFIFGGLATLACFVLSLFLLPESVGYLAAQRPLGALEKINKTLKRMNQPQIVQLPEIKATAAKQPKAYGLLFSREFRFVTLALVIAYFAHMMTHYFFLKWVPKIVVDMGYPPPLAGGVLVWVNIGGLAAAFLMGILAKKVPIRALVICALFLTAAGITFFGVYSKDISTLKVASTCAGFFAQASMVGIYALFAHVFPTKVRSSGTGLIMGLGRGGAVLGPIAGGILFTSGAGLGTVAMIMAAGSFVGGIAILFLKFPASEEAVAGNGKQQVA